MITRLVGADGAKLRGKEVTTLDWAQAKLLLRGATGMLAKTTKFPVAPHDGVAVKVLSVMLPAAGALVVLSKTSYVNPTVVSTEKVKDNVLGSAVTWGTQGMAKAVKLMAAPTLVFWT